MPLSLELFSGAGGLAKGLELAGFSHVGCVEFNKDACNSLRKNFPPTIVHHVDVREFDFTSCAGVDVIAGGPPCQPFSLGGKHQGDHDNRDMFPLAVKAIEQLRPSAFIFENVKGLLRESFSLYFKYIILRLSHPSVTFPEASDWRKNLRTLEKVALKLQGTSEYTVQWKLMNAADFGVPQTRERVVIVGTRADLHLHWSFPAAKHSKERLLWEKYVTGEYWSRNKVAKSDRDLDGPSATAEKDRLVKTYGLTGPTGLAWRTVRDAIGDLPHPSKKHTFRDHLFRDGARVYPGHVGSAIDLPSKTIKAGGHGVPGGENMVRSNNGDVRYFTVLEAKRIQTFPDDYHITGSWGEALRQIGNAVPVKLAEIIGQQLQQCLKGKAAKPKRAHAQRALKHREGLQ